MKNKKVLILAPPLTGKGGVSLYFSVVYPELVKRGEFAFGYFPVGSSVGDGLWFQYARYIRRLRSGTSDLVHINTSFGFKSYMRDAVYVIISRFFRRKVIVFIRGWSFHSKQVGSLWFRLIFNATYKNVDALFLLNSDVERSIVGLGYPSHKIYRMTTVVDDSGFSEKAVGLAVTKRIVEEGVLKLLFLSRIEEKKGIYELLEAVKILNSDFYKVKLTLAGSGTIERDIDQYIFDHCLSDSVERVGFVKGEEKEKLLLDSHVFCLPSYTEGMPNSVLEAMCYGMGLVTTDVGALKDIVKEENGFLVPVKNSNALAKAISNYFDWGKLESHMVHNSNSSIDEYGCKQVVDKLTSAYGEIM